LCGSEYALLRPEFLAWREYSQERRLDSEVKHLLINLGGVDKNNVTARVLRALEICDLPSDLTITVVMGATAPWLESVRYEASKIKWHTRIEVGVESMAEVMAESDIAIGAAGSTAWERCALGLPSVMLILAGNQRYVARTLDACGAAISLRVNNLERKLDRSLQTLILKRSDVSIRGMEQVDGKGCERINRYLNEIFN
jgi:spore coat polysaccharide biosynthesis predicted glycosyltransferase SpsG